MNCVVCGSEAMPGRQVCSACSRLDAGMMFEMMTNYKNRMENRNCVSCPLFKSGKNNRKSEEEFKK